jgi:mycothiol synthase
VLISALTAADAARLGALCGEALDLPEDAAEAASVVGRLLSPPAGRRTAWLGAGDDGVVLASMSQREPGVGHVDLLAVRPAARGRGTGSALLRAAERALAGLGAGEVRLAGNLPCYAWPGVDVRYTPAMCLAVRHGYTDSGTAWNMTAPLAGLAADDAAQRRLHAAGVEPRRAGPADAPVLTRWVEATWPGWGWEVGQSLDRPGAGCHVAWRDGTPVGFAAYGALRPSVFGPMGTDPDAEGLGIGRVLLRRCLVEQRERLGLTSAQIGWAGPLGFYARTVGARVGRVFWLYRKVLTG